MNMAMVLALLVPLAGFHGSTSDVYDLLAQKYVAKGELDLAFTCLERAMEADPRSIKPYLSRAFIYLKQGKSAFAIDDFSRAIELRPDAAYVYVSRGLVYTEAGEREKAAVDFRRACGLGDSSGCSFLRGVEEGE
jgi:Tfp pilus assembly protein PilF